MTATPEAQALISYLEAHLDDFLEDLRQLCAIECPTASKAGVDQAAAWVRGWVAARGWELREWPDATAGDGLVATARGAGGPRIMLVAHLDTVYPVGTAAARPLRRRVRRTRGRSLARRGRRRTGRRGRRRSGRRCAR